MNALVKGGAKLLRWESPRLCRGGSTNPSNYELDKAQKAQLKYKTFYGNEIVAGRLCLMNMFLHNIGEKHRLVAEDARRAGLLVDGLGLVLSPTEMRRLAAASEATSEELAKWDDPAWFASSEVPGIARATENLEESAFWSAHLFDASARRVDRVLAIAASGTLACFILAVRIFSPLPDSGIAHKGNSDDFLVVLVDYNSAVESARMMAGRTTQADPPYLVQSRSSVILVSW